MGGTILEDGEWGCGLVWGFCDPSSCSRPEYHTKYHESDGEDDGDEDGDGGDDGDAADGDGENVQDRKENGMESIESEWINQSIGISDTCGPQIGQWLPARRLQDNMPDGRRHVGLTT